MSDGLHKCISATLKKLSVNKMSSNVILELCLFTEQGLFIIL